MQALEFDTIIENDKILIPKEIKGLNNQTHIRVIILIEDEAAQEEQDFKRFANEQFLKGYAESDAIYDDM